MGNCCSSEVPATPGGTPLEGLVKGAQKGDHVCFRDKLGRTLRGDVVRRVDHRVRVRDEHGGLSGWIDVKDLLPAAACVHRS